MKKLFFIMLSMSLVMTVAAQKRSRIFVSSYMPVYSSVGFGFGLYPYYSPYAYRYNNFYNRPSQLDNEIADINHEYADKIESARLDKTLSGKERRAEIKRLKNERDKKINDLKVNYHRQ